MSAVNTFGIYLASVFFMILFIRGGSAIECYECNSAENQQGENCTDYFNKEQGKIVECPSNTTQCRKIIQEIGGKKRITRQCAPTPGPTHCIERAGTYRVKVWYCHCEEENCNAASQMTLTLWSSVLVLVGGMLASVL